MNRNVFFLFLGIAAFAVVRGASELESCWTPSLDSGVCMSIYDCPPLLNLLRRLPNLNLEEKTRLRNSQCGYEDNKPKVCCPQIVMMSRSRPVPFPMSSYSTTNMNSVEVSYGPPDVRNHPKIGLINNEICGSITQSRIIFGNKTGLLEFPWMALIAYNVDGTQTNFKCGGSLINKRYVLTAAHCVTELSPGVVLAGVRIGEHDLRTEIDCEVEEGAIVFCADQYQNFFIESFHYHSGYNKKKHENDIALIRMDGDAHFKSPNIKPICLPVGDSASIRFKKAIVTGWGRTETGEKSKELLQARLELVPNQKCAAIYAPSGISITDKQLCAGGETRVDSCFGDSGGPFQYPDTTDSDQPRYVQYGVVSFGPENCGLPGYPGVYTKISYFMDWILDTIVE